jgi:hypothetical protein
MEKKGKQEEFVKTFKGRARLRILESRTART